MHRPSAGALVGVAAAVGEDEDEDDGEDDAVGDAVVEREADVEADGDVDAVGDAEADGEDEDDAEAAADADSASCSCRLPFLEPAGVCVCDLVSDAVKVRVLELVGDRVALGVPVRVATGARVRDTAAV